MSSHQYVRFDKIAWHGHKPKWEVSTPGGDDALGQVRWFNDFGAYTFWPASPFIVLGAGALKEIATFIDLLHAKAGR